jgi:hypothetical protein
VEGGFFNVEPKVAFTLDANALRTDNPTSNQEVTFVDSAGIGSSTWLGANVTQVASLNVSGRPFGVPFVLQSSPPIGLQEVTAIALTLLDAVLGPFPAPSASGDEGQSCARLDKATGETLAAAYTSLKTFLSTSNSCPACDSKIFQPLKMTRGTFLTYLGQEPRFCDGTKSLEMSTTIGHENVGGKKNSTVADYFRQEQQFRLTAATVLDGPSKPLWIFFNPAEIVNDKSRVDDHLYPSLMFHEALHGYTRLGDGDPLGVHGSGLCQILKIDQIPDFSSCALHTVDITTWIEDFVTFPRN